MGEIGKHVRELLGELAKHAELLGDAARLVRERRDEVERVAGRSELVLAVVGECQARSALVNRLCGQTLLEPTRREPPLLVPAFRRGAVNDYRARLQDGSSEHFVRIDADQSGELAAQLDELERRLRAASEAEAAAAGETAAARTRAQTAVGTLRAQAEVAARALPAVLLRRPPWWAVWAWLARLVLAPFWRRQRAAHARAMAQLGAGAAELAALAQAGVPTPVQPESSSAVVTLEAKRARLSAQLRELRAARAERFIAAVRALTDEAGRGHGVARLTVDVPGEALPVGLVLLDVPSGCTVDDADGWLAAGRAQTEQSAALEARRIPAVPGDTPLVQLMERLRGERLRRVAVRAGEAVSAARTALAAREQAAVQSWRERLAAAMALRVTDPAALAAQQLARCTGRITERAHMAIEHATRQLGEGMAQIDVDWHAWLAAANNVEALRTAAATIDQQSAARLREVQEQTQLAMMMVVRGAVRDLAPEALAGLEPKWRALGAAPEAPEEQIGDGELQVCAALTAGAAGPLLEAGWLASLFKSFEALRGKALARLDERLARLRAAASAELLDAEPPITAALRATAERMCTHATQRLAELAEARVVAEKTAVERERIELAPVVALRAKVDAEVARIKQAGAA